MKKIHKKKEVYFIATKYKNKPIKIDFYTNTGEAVSVKDVKKEQDKFGTKFYHCD